MATRSGKAHEARKKLFARGVRRGWVTLEEIEAALPEGALTPSERWLLFYSLRAAGVEIRGLEASEEPEGREAHRPDESAPP
jgi:hypothetical protein